MTFAGLMLFGFAVCGWVAYIVERKLFAQSHQLNIDLLQTMKESSQRWRQLSLDVLKEYDPDAHRRVCEEWAEMHARGLLRRVMLNAGSKSK